MNMEKCRWEETCGHEYCNLTDCPEYEATPMTNADRIRAMTDEELAAVMVKGDLHFCTIAETDCIYGWHTPNCIAHALKWLQQPVKEDAG